MLGVGKSFIAGVATYHTLRYPCPLMSFCLESIEEVYRGMPLYVACFRLSFLTT